jgi:peptidoglycan/LPS O-acetylase OafA/YrhL
MLSHLQLLATQIPFVLWSAVAFYACLLVILAIPALRTRFPRVFHYPPPSSHSHLPGFDGLRGLAVLAVLCLHTWQWLRPFNNRIFDFFLFMSPGLRQDPSAKMGAKSVAVFIVLSGFLVYRSLKNRCGTADDIGRYFKRRFFRIYPLYFATVIALALTGSIYPDPSRLQGFLSEALMLRTLNYHAFANPPAWSLYVEVLFYLLLPIWIILTRNVALPAAVTAFTLLVLTGNEVVLPANRELALIKYFFVGIIACEISLRPWFSRWSRMAGASLLCLGLVLLYLDLSRIDPVAWGVSRSFGLVGIDFPVVRPDDLTACLGIGFGLAMLGILRFPPVSRILDLFPFRFLGLISYSIFLWHGFIILANTPIRFDGLGGHIGQMTLASDNGMGTFFGVYVPAVLLYSALSYALIERPFRNLGS